METRVAGCACDNDQFDGQSPSYKRALIAVIAINAVMFFVEMSAGFLGGSRQGSGVAPASALCD